MEIEKQGTSHQCVFSRMYIFNTWLKYSGERLTHTERIQHVCDYIIDNLSLEDKENANFEGLITRIKYICKKITELWRKNHSITEKVIKNHTTWLDTPETVILEAANQSQLNVKPSLKRGRPMKDFGECSKRTKQRRIAEISEINQSVASALSDSSITSKIAIEPTNAEVLSLIVEAKLTKHQYLLIKNFVNSKLPQNIFPSYKIILNEKKRCYPEPEKIAVTESSAEIDLQALLDHTASRLLESQKAVLHTLPEDSLDLVLIGKWGFDGSTGQSEYKQNFSDSNVDDSNLFVTSYVPLQLLKKSIDNNNLIIWKNPRPSSTRYCRPIRFQFKKETTAVSVEEERYFNQKISALLPSVISINNRNLNVHHNLQLTMVDGKVCNALSNTSSAKCYICKAYSKEMNDIESCLTKPKSEDCFAFGLSPLHAWIRFFEFFIHVSYRLNIKKWQVRGQLEKEQFAERKKHVQTQFRQQLGLIVDKPKAGGGGTSNDGNTARNFFENPDISAEITGLDKNLIERCATILQVLGSGYKINTDKFREFALETARKIVETYPWYYLPSSVHKILMHGSDVIEHALLSIGELSEEAAEARNKDIKSFRLQHTRKMSRIVTNTDLLNRLLLSSDPVITEIRHLPRKKKSILSKASLELLF